MEDVVYLKNGSIIHGTIIEQVPNQTIKIKTKDGNVFVYKMEEILKYTKEEKQSPDSNKNNSSNNDEYKTTGFTNITELEGGLGGNAGGGGNSVIGFGLRTINGFQINEHFSLGLGIGINYQPSIIRPDIILNASSVYYPSYIENNYNYTYNLLSLPIFVDFRYYYTANKHAFFAYANIGYALLLSSSNESSSSSYTNTNYDPLTGSDYVMNVSNSDSYSGGLMYGFGLGYKLFISQNTAWIISIGLNITNITNNYSYSFNNYYTGLDALTTNPNMYTTNDSQKFGSYYSIRTGFAF
jgi:hypothetical protein